jgi:hypothetical protein
VESGGKKECDFLLQVLSKFTLTYGNRWTRWFLSNNQLVKRSMDGPWAKWMWSLEHGIANLKWNIQSYIFYESQTFPNSILSQIPSERQDPKKKKNLFEVLKGLKFSFLNLLQAESWQGAADPTYKGKFSFLLLSPLSVEIDSPVVTWFGS